MSVYPDLSNIKKILVIKMRHSGDVLLMTPVLTQLKQALPQADIDAMVYQDTAPVLQNNRYISQVITYDKNWKKKNWFQKIYHEVTLLRFIRKQHYQIVINLTEGDRGAIVALISGAKIRVGFDPQGQGFFKKKSIYSHLVLEGAIPKHIVEKNLDAIRSIGIFPSQWDRDIYFQEPDPGFILKVLNKNLLQPKSYLLIHPFSRGEFKRWPMASFAQLIKKLHLRGETIALTSHRVPNEIAAVEKIMQLAPEVPIINLAGQDDLQDFAALILGSKLLICIDALPLHLAVGLKAPVVTIFGPTSETIWGPWNHPKAEVIKLNYPCRPCLQMGCGGSGYSDCLVQLSVDHVLEAVENKLKNQEKDQLNQSLSTASV